MNIHFVAVDLGEDERAEPPWLDSAVYFGLQQLEERLAAELVLDEIDAR